MSEVTPIKTKNVSLQRNNWVFDDLTVENIFQWKTPKNFIAGTNQGGLTDVENKIKLLTVTSFGSRGRKS